MINKKEKIILFKIARLSGVFILLLFMIAIVMVERRQSVQYEAMRTPVTMAVRPRQDKIKASPYIDYQKSIPVLMYHHVRNYNNPSDPINTNLSVPVESFREQVRALKNAGYQTITFNNLLNRQIVEKPIIITFDDGYQDVFDSAYPVLRENNQTGTVFVMSNFIGSPGYLDKEKIELMLKGGFELGSHTISHPDLAKADPSTLEYQIKSSKEILEKEFSRPIEVLCYPSGRHNLQVIEIARRAGYRAAVTVNFQAPSNDLLTLPRVRVNNTDTAESLLTKIENFNQANNRFLWNYQ